jgi:hypothetical protein
MIERRVQFLTGVELAELRAWTRALVQPTAVVGDPARERVDVPAQLRTRPQHETEHERYRQREAGEHVDTLDELAAADERAQVADVEHRAGSHQRDEERGVQPVHDTLRTVEPHDRRDRARAGGRAHVGASSPPFERPTQASTS